MARPYRVKRSRLPNRAHLLSRFAGGICERRGTLHVAAQKFDAALRKWIERRGVEMNPGILIARLQGAEQSIWRDVVPSSLKKAKAIRLALVLKAVRRNERRGHALPAEDFESRGHGPIEEIEARTVVEQIELISRGCLDPQTTVGEKNTAIQVTSGILDRNCLRRPLAAAREKQVGSFSQCTTRFSTIPSEPAIPFCLFHPPAARGLGKIACAERRARLAGGNIAVPRRDRLGREEADFAAVGVRSCLRKGGSLDDFVELLG